MVLAAGCLVVPSAQAQSAQTARGTWSNHRTPFGLDVNTNGTVSFSLDPSSGTFTCTANGTGTTRGIAHGRTADGTVTVRQTACSGRYDPATGSVDGTISISAPNRTTWTWYDEEKGLQSKVETDTETFSGKVTGNVGTVGGTFEFSDGTVTWTLTSAAKLNDGSTLDAETKQVVEQCRARVTKHVDQWKQYRERGGDKSLGDYLEETCTKEELPRIKEDMMILIIAREHEEQARELAASREAFVAAETQARSHTSRLEASIQRSSTRRLGAGDARQAVGKLEPAAVARPGVAVAIEIGDRLAKMNDTYAKISDAKEQVDKITKTVQDWREDRRRHMASYERGEIDATTVGQLHLVDTVNHATDYAPTHAAGTYFTLGIKMGVGWIRGMVPGASSFQRQTNMEWTDSNELFDEADRDEKGKEVRAGWGAARDPALDQDDRSWWDRMTGVTRKEKAEQKARAKRNQQYH